VRYKDLPPAVFRSFGFPSVDDIGNMFQFKAEFSDRYYADRSIEFSRSLKPHPARRIGLVRALVVCFWHTADVPLTVTNVRFQGNNGHDAGVTHVR
jgi:hypothetical protein